MDHPVQNGRRDGTAAKGAGGKANGPDPGQGPPATGEGGASQDARPTGDRPARIETCHPDGNDDRVRDLVEQLLGRGTSGRIAPPTDPSLEKRCPLLWGLLTQDTYRDSTVRVLPSIKIERVVGGYEATLQDHASHQQITVALLTLDDLAKALERALGKGGDQFREYRSFKVKDPLKRTKRKNG